MREGFTRAARCCMNSSSDVTRFEVSRQEVFSFRTTWPAKLLWTRSWQWENGGLRRWAGHHQPQSPTQSLHLWAWPPNRLPLSQPVND